MQHEGNLWFCGSEYNTVKRHVLEILAYLYIKQWNPLERNGADFPADIKVFRP